MPRIRTRTRTRTSASKRASAALAASLPQLRAKLEEERQFRADQLAELARAEAARAQARAEAEAARAEAGTSGTPLAAGTDLAGAQVTAAQLAGAEVATDEPAGVSDTDQARGEVAILLANAARQALADIDLALRRMRGGRYGTCAHCGCEIDLERLFAVPQAGLCAPCQRAQERP